jgi:hypothetical protein
MSLGKFWKKIKKTVKKVVRVLKELPQRTTGLFDFITSLLGWTPRKYLRLQVYVLTENGKPIASLATVDGWLAKTKTLFKDLLNIEIVAPQPRVGQITVVDPSTDALTVAGCGLGNFFSDASDWFDDHCRYAYGSGWSPTLDATGAGEPVYCFVIKAISSGEDGCSFALLHDYSVIDATPKVTSMAHEIGHLLWLAPLGLHHDSPKDNLMASGTIRDESRSTLTRWQIAVARNSRYVTYWRTYP